MRFSVIVPTYNRPKHLRACLQSIAGLDYPRSALEVIVCDDASDVPAEQTVGSIGGALSPRFVRLAGNQGPAAARNLGASHASGEFLAFVDDDCLVAPDWLRQMESALLRHPGCAVGSLLAVAHPDDLCSSACHSVLDTVYRYYNRDPDHACFLGTAVLALPADGFRQIGGFNPGFRTAEDRDFCARWLRRGFGLVYAKEAKAVHDSVMTLRQFLRRHYHYGIGGYHFRRGMAAKAGRGFRLEPMRFYADMLAAPWRQRPLPRAAAVGALVALSQVASTVGLASAWWLRVTRP